MKHCEIQYIGFQPGFGVKPGFALYNFIGPSGESIEVGSTVTAQTLRKHGFTHVTIHNAPTPQPVCLN